ncbi:unnamed protein product [Urochloa decumbens]|uniref:Peptidase A1 domain-containing protein n=1 Tax=Urochloa decumbens TaxID=240449 RepID=A0ABC9AU92_9POAL
MSPLSLLVILACAALSPGAADGLRIELTPIPSNPDATARHGRLVAGRELASSDDTTTITAPTRNDGAAGLQYLMTVSIGTPPVAFPAVLDTGSNVIMAKCAPCVTECGFGPSTAPPYDPSLSTTVAELPCNSSLRAGICDAAADGGCPPCTHKQEFSEGWVSYTLAMETFTFGSTAAGDQQVAVLAFGCVNGSGGGWGGASGMVGLGRGALSLVKQLHASRFSYCLTPYHDGNGTSTLVVGPAAALDEKSSTPFVAGPSEGTKSTHYYLNLTGISIGENLLSIPADAFALSADGGGGIIIDSGWTTTSLVDVAYQRVRAEVVSLVTLQPIDAPKTKLELCFDASSEESPPVMPDMTLHFDGADMVLPAESYMFMSSRREWCLCMHNVTAAQGSVLGNYQQQNIHFLFDLDKETLSFAPADCTTI